MATFRATSCDDTSITVKVSGLATGDDGIFYVRFFISETPNDADYSFDGYTEPAGEKTSTTYTYSGLEPDTLYYLKCATYFAGNTSQDKDDVIVITQKTDPEQLTYYAQLILDGNGGALYSGATEYPVPPVSKKSDKAYAYVDVKYNCNFVRDGYTFAGYSENPKGIFGEYGKNDTYSIKSYSQDADDPEIATLYAVWHSELLAVDNITVTYDTAKLSISLDGLADSTGNPVYYLVGSLFDGDEEVDLNTEASLRPFQSEYFGGPSHTTSGIFKDLKANTTYKYIIRIFSVALGYQWTGEYVAGIFTTEDKYVDVSIVDCAFLGRSTDEESKLRAIVTLETNDNGSTGRYYVRVDIYEMGSTSITKTTTSPTFSMNPLSEHTMNFDFTGLLGGSFCEVYIYVYDDSGLLHDEDVYPCNTTELKRPYQWEWNPEIEKGGRVETTEIGEYVYRAKFVLAIQWKEFIETIQLVADYVGLSIDSTLVSAALNGVSPGASMLASQGNAAMLLIDSMNPPTPVPHELEAGKTRLTAAFFNGLRDSLNSIE